MNLPAKSQTEFAFPQPEMVLQFFENEFREHDFDYEKLNDGTLKANTLYGKAEVSGGNGRVKISLACHDAQSLDEIREGISHHFAELSKDIELFWTGDFNVGALPNNFILGKVVSSEKLGSSFLRMTFESKDINRFATKGLHFRLCRASDANRKPIWPTISQKGTTEWPEGDDALIDKVYTVRSIDLTNNQMTADIFIHEGGFTCEWAKTNPVGEIVGLWGPGGGWFPEGEQVFMAGDETALPTILRSLEELPKQTSGKAAVLVDAPVDIQDVANQTDIELTWLFRSEQADLTEWVREHAFNGNENSYHWFASHQKEAKAVRKIFLEEKSVKKKQMYCATYWH